MNGIKWEMYQCEGNKMGNVYGCRKEDGKIVRVKKIKWQNVSEKISRFFFFFFFLFLTPG